MKLPTSQLLDQGNVSCPQPLVQSAFMVRLWFCCRCSRKGWLGADENNKDKTGAKPLNLQEVRGHVWVNISFPKDVSMPFGHFHCQICRLTQIFCYWRCTCGFGVNKKVEHSLCSLRDLGTFHRMVPWSAGENRELSFPEPQPVTCSTLQEAEKQQGLRRLSVPRVWGRPHMGTTHQCLGHPHAAEGAHWKVRWPQTKVFSQFLNLPRLWPPRTHTELSCAFPTRASRRMWDSLQGGWTKVCTEKWVHHIL